MDIERLAQEADPDYGNALGDMAEAIVGKDAIWRFAALIAEECAKVADQYEEGPSAGPAIRAMFTAP